MKRWFHIGILTILSPAILAIGAFIGAIAGACVGAGVILGLAERPTETSGQAQQAPASPPNN